MARLTKRAHAPPTTQPHQPHNQQHGADGLDQNHLVADSAAYLPQSYHKTCARTTTTVADTEPVYVALVVGTCANAASPPRRFRPRRRRSNSAPEPPLYYHPKHHQFLQPQQQQQQQQQQPTQPPAQDPYCAYPSYMQPPAACALTRSWQSSMRDVAARASTRRFSEFQPCECCVHEHVTETPAEDTPRRERRGSFLRRMVSTLRNRHGGSSKSLNSTSSTVTTTIPVTTSTAATTTPSSGENYHNSLVLQTCALGIQPTPVCRRRRVILV